MPHYDTDACCDTGVETRRKVAYILRLGKNLMECCSGVQCERRYLCFTVHLEATRKPSG